MILKGSIISRARKNIVKTFTRRSETKKEGITSLLQIDQHIITCLISDRETPFNSSAYAKS